MRTAVGARIMPEHSRIRLIPDACLCGDERLAQHDCLQILEILLGDIGGGNGRVRVLQHLLLDDLREAEGCGREKDGGRQKRQTKRSGRRWDGTERSEANNEDARPTDSERASERVARYTSIHETSERIR